VDLLLLQRLTAELDEHLRGARIEQVWALPKNDVVLALRRRSAPRLWFSAEPDQPHLYLRDVPHATPERPPGFAMAARNLLNGRRIATIRCLHGDRIVEICCAGDDAIRVVFELIPRRATAMVVDGADEVRAVWQPRRGRPGLGDTYSPPGRDTRPPLVEVEDSTWDDLHASPDTGTLVRGLLRSIAGMSPLVAREIAWRHGEGMAFPEAAAMEMERAVEEPPAPRIYAPCPLNELSRVPAARRFVLSPYPLHHLEERPEAHVECFDTVREAAAVFYPLRACLQALQGARDALLSALEIGVARTRRTLDAVSEDAENVGDPDKHRHWADLLLSYPNAERDGAVARVPDPYAEDRDAVLRIPVDPARSLVDNAESYYNRARRAERSAERTATRRARLQKRLAALEALQSQADEAARLGDCVHIARAARAHGVSVRTERWQQPECTRPGHGQAEREAPSTPSGPARRRAREEARRTRATAGVDRYTSSDGHEILVGRSAQGNERLTHKLAAAHDFWLHAEGPGSHVVIRNPHRDDAPGDDALREAAALAAYFSRARDATKVNVRWTQVRHVKKPRGAAAGQVVLRRSQSYLAEPLSPAALFAADREEEDRAP
jgi:predicted ribosome quality control (RQC) complex YloA/Tae2 family protein